MCKRGQRSPIRPSSRARSTFQKELCSAKNLIVLNFRPLFMPLASPVGIRDADRPEQVFLPPGDHTE